MLDRRVFLGALAGASVGALAGCTSSGPTPTATTPTVSSSSSPTASPTASASATRTTAALPSTTPWQPTSSEVSPAVKVRAVRLLEAIGAWPSGGHGLAAARARVAAVGYDPRLADQAAVLLSSAPQAAIRVVDAQYGGILSSSSSVLVVLQQWRLSADGASVLAGGDDRRRTPRRRITALARHGAAPGCTGRTLRAPVWARHQPAGQYPAAPAGGRAR